MRHWILDDSAVPPPTWQQALPQARRLERRRAGEVPADQPGILWCRLHAGEAPSDILRGLSLGDGQRLVLLCDEPEEATVIDALAAGAAGCCNSHAAPEVLQQVALVVDNGGLWIGQALLSKLVGSTSRILGQRPRPPRDDWAQFLSERECQVARRVAGGASNKEIANQLDISERTVKAHLTSIFEKLNLRDRLQLSLKINGLTV